MIKLARLTRFETVCKSTNSLAATGLRKIVSKILFCKNISCEIPESSNLFARLGPTSVNKYSQNLLAICNGSRFFWCVVALNLGDSVFPFCPCLSFVVTFILKLTFSVKSSQRVNEMAERSSVFSLPTDAERTLKNKKRKARANSEIPCCLLKLFKGMTLCYPYTVFQWVQPMTETIRNGVKLVLCVRRQVKEGCILFSFILAEP